MNYAKYLYENKTRGAIGLTAGTLLALSTSALAHHPSGSMTPQTFSEGLMSGFGHPIIGLDHLAFLVAAMLLTYALKGASRFLVPLAFVGATIGGTVLHLGAANIPMAEMLIALSVVIGGVLAITRHYPGALALAAIFAGSGILHGYAYGEAIVGAETTPLVAYLIGFSLIQYALIVGGVLGLDRLATRSESARLLATRIGGAAASLTGMLFLATSLI